MNTLKSNAVHMKFSMEQKGISEFSLGTSESKADERYLWIRIVIQVWYCPMSKTGKSVLHD